VIARSRLPPRVCWYRAGIILAINDLDIASLLPRTTRCIKHLAEPTNEIVIDKTSFCRN
jgi:hypothetical protein